MNYLLLFLLLTCTTSVWAQSAAKTKRLADQLFYKGQYEESLAEYYKIRRKYNGDAGFTYRLGVALFKTAAYPSSIQQLRRHLEQSRKPAPLVNYYLARANHLQDSFLIAAQYYKQHLRGLDDDSPQRTVFKRLILQCVHGPKIQQINSLAIVTGLGTTINSTADDYRICFNPLLPSSLFFSSKRPLHSKRLESNIYCTDQLQGTFLPAQPLQVRYNSPLNETLLTFFDNGYQMLLLKELSNGNTSIFKDNFDADSVEVLLPFSTALVSDAGDSDHYFVNDSMVIFASTRAGGYGGSDLYYAVCQNGVWQYPHTMGASINGPYDEIGPHLAPNGLELFFSSNRAEGMGGHDIYRATYEATQNVFSGTKNMGVPINSSADDKDFTLGADTYKAFLSSNRVGGLGGLDLYAVYFRKPVVTVAAANKRVFISWMEEHRESYINGLDSMRPPVPFNSLDRPNTSVAQAYTLKPIYYDANTGQLTSSRNTLLALEKLLKNNSSLRVILSAHSNNNNAPDTDLYLTIKQAETVAQQLLASGVVEKQLLLRGCSQNYPLASAKNFDGTDNPLAQNINQRINITFYGQEQLPENITITVVEPSINAVMQSQEYTRYKEKLKGLSYKVKLLESPTIFQHAILKQYPNTTTEKRPSDQAVSYLIGLENSFVDIKYTHQQLLNKGFEKAQIVAYIDGWPITEAEAQVLFTNYPDLEFFLEYRATAN